MKGHQFQYNFLYFVILEYGSSQVAQMVKNPHAVQETWAQSLGWDDPLEKGMAAHSSILAWRIPMAGHGVAKSRDTTE